MEMTLFIQLLTLIVLVSFMIFTFVNRICTCIENCNNTKCFIDFSKSNDKNKLPILKVDEENRIIKLVKEENNNEKDV